MQGLKAEQRLKLLGTDHYKDVWLRWVLKDDNPPLSLDDRIILATLYFKPPMELKKEDVAGPLYAVVENYWKEVQDKYKKGFKPQKEVVSKFTEQQKGRGGGGPPFAEKATNDSGVHSTAEPGFLEEKQQDPEDMLPDAPEDEEEEDGVGALNTSVEDPEAGGDDDDEGFEDAEDFKDAEDHESKTSVPNTATAFSTQYRFY